MGQTATITATPRRRTRPRIADHLHVGMRVIHTGDDTIWRIANIYRHERQAQLVARDGGQRMTLPWTRLFHEYEAIQPFGAVR